MNLNTLTSNIECFNKAAITTINPTNSWVPKGYSGDSHIVVNTPPSSLNLATTGRAQGSIFLAAIDAGNIKKSGDYPVVLALGANYGQGGYYLTKTNGVLHNTMMKKNADSALSNSGLVLNDYWLIGFNIFPWITLHSWTDSNNKPIRNSWHSLGFNNPLNVIKQLCGSINPDAIIFHGLDVWKHEFLSIMTGSAHSGVSNKAILTWNLGYSSRVDQLLW